MDLSFFLYIYTHAAAYVVQASHRVLIDEQEQRSCRLFTLVSIFSIAERSIFLPREWDVLVAILERDRPNLICLRLPPVNSTLHGPASLHSFPSSPFLIGPIELTSRNTTLLLNFPAADDGGGDDKHKHLDLLCSGSPGVR